MNKKYRCMCTNIESFSLGKLNDIVFTAKSIRQLHKNIAKTDIFNGRGGVMTLNIKKIK